MYFTKKCLHELQSKVKKHIEETDAISFLMLVNKISFCDAIELLLKIYDVEPEVWKEGMPPCEDVPDNETKEEQMERVRKYMKVARRYE